MTVYLLAGGGTAGHVNPLLAVAHYIRAQEPDSRVLVLGTDEGLESRLVPEAGFELLTIPKVPFPRSFNGDLFTFPFKLRAAVRQTRQYLEEFSVDVVVGFGGFASPPAYLAARKLKIPIAIHEANRKPGLANKLGSRYTEHIGVAFPETGFPHETLVGIPLRKEITELNRESSQREARSVFGLGDRPTLLVTGGSQGAVHLNSTISERLEHIISAGFQIIHLIGGKNELPEFSSPHYVPLNYLNRMDLALALADVAVARSGAITVMEFSAIGLPAVFVPLPHGNGEQALNAEFLVHAGGAMMVSNSDFTPEWIDRELLPLLLDPHRLKKMRESSYIRGIRDGDRRMFALIQRALAMEEME